MAIGLAHLANFQLGLPERMEADGASHASQGPKITAPPLLTAASASVLRRPESCPMKRGKEHRFPKLLPRRCRMPQSSTGDIADYVSLQGRSVDSASFSLDAPNPPPPVT